MSDTGLVAIRCRGCRRTVGLGKKDAAVYCDERCYRDFPAVSTEARDALVEAVYYKGRYTFDRLGDMFGFTRQRAQQIVSKRDIRKGS